MEALGIILIGTGIIIFLSGGVILRSIKRTINESVEASKRQGDLDLIQEDKKTAREFHRMVKRTLRILSVIGITFILVGIIMIVFAP